MGNILAGAGIGAAGAVLLAPELGPVSLGVGAAIGAGLGLAIEEIEDNALTLAFIAAGALATIYVYKHVL